MLSRLLDARSSNQEISVEKDPRRPCRLILWCNRHRSRISRRVDSRTSLAQAQIKQETVWCCKWYQRWWAKSSWDYQRYRRQEKKGQEIGFFLNRQINKNNPRCDSLLFIVKDKSLSSIELSVILGFFFFQISSFRPLGPLGHSPWRTFRITISCT